MKLKKRTKIFIIVLIVLLFLSIILFISGFIKDKNDNKKAMNIIKKDYNNFSDQAVEFNNYRDKIYDEIFTDTYYESFIEKQSEFYNYFKEYENIIDKIIKDSSNLYKYCDGIYYTEIDVNTMCLTFSNDYETMVNSFILDVKNYNTLIKEYNKYLKDHNLNDNNLSKYKTNKKYLDYNKDKKYSGKE